MNNLSQSLVIIGAQWGDEGKGKLVDYLTAHADYVVRFQGGNNAGHTLVVNGKKTKLNLVPSGILRPSAKCLIGAGVVLDGAGLLDEIAGLKAAGVDVNPERLLIDHRVTLVIDAHSEIDKAREERLGESKIGTTGRGIGPAHEARVGRTGIRAADLLHLNTIKDRLADEVSKTNLYLEKVIGSDRRVDFNKVWSTLETLARELPKYLGDVSAELYDATISGKRVVFEGAQGSMLDNLFGTFPYVTSSCTLSGSASTGCGIGPKSLGHVLGVAKAYTTRVGAGPFPTELDDAVGDAIREKGAEFGTVTGRPRRCGWFDAYAVQYAVRLSGIDSLAITKLDVLAGVEKIKLCYGYLKNGQPVKSFPVTAEDYSGLVPQYAEFDGWGPEVSSATKWHKLPASARLYLAAVSEIVRCPISIVSVGADRVSTLFSAQTGEVASFAASLT